MLRCVHGAGDDDHGERSGIDATWSNNEGMTFVDNTITNNSGYGLDVDLPMAELAAVGDGTREHGDGN